MAKSVDTSLQQRQQQPQRQMATVPAEAFVEEYLSDADNCRSFTATQLVQSLGLTKVRVAADGSCWIYAVLTSLGVSAGTEALPTASDLALEGQMRRVVGAWLRATGVFESLDVEDQASLGDSPSYKDGQLMDTGGYSTTEMMVAQAVILGCVLVLSLHHLYSDRNPD